MDSFPGMEAGTGTNPDKFSVLSVFSVAKSP